MKLRKRFREWLFRDCLPINEFPCKDYTILIKRGEYAGLPELEDGEFGIATDKHRLFVGTSEGNYEIVMKRTGGNDG